MKKAIIYILTNKINRKQYVGQTIRTLDERFKEHCESKSYIGNSLRKNGLENFDKQFFFCESEKASLFEKHFILELNTLYPFGYNLTAGGEDGARSDLAKQNMRKPKTEQGRQNIAKSNNDPERLKKASERFLNGGSPANRPEVQEKLRQAALRNIKLGIGNGTYFSNHLLIGENNHKWKGPNEIRICANPLCKKEFEVRPGQEKKYCNRKCMGLDPIRSQNSKDKQKGKTFSSEHIQHITEAQQKRRENERLVVNN